MRNRIGENLNRYGGRYEIPILEDCDVFYPTNSCHLFVYMIPSSRDIVLLKYPYGSTDSGNYITVQLCNRGIYTPSCFGRLYKRLTDEERRLLKPMLDGLLKVLDGIF